MKTITDGITLGEKTYYATEVLPELKLGEKAIDENGTYLASDDDLDGYSKVEVEVE